MAKMNVLRGAPSVASSAADDMEIYFNKGQNAELNKEEESAFTCS